MSLDGIFICLIEMVLKVLFVKFEWNNVNSFFHQLQRNDLKKFLLMSDKKRWASGHSLQIQFKSNGIGHYTIGQWMTMSDNGGNYR